MATIKPGATRSVLTTSYEIYVIVNGVRSRVGGIQSINPSESKDITPSFEIGTTLSGRVGEPYELTPGLVRNKSLSISRIRLYNKNMLSAFGTEIGAETLYEQSIPFDIEETLTIPKFNADGTPDPNMDNATIKTIKIYKDCLISSLGSTRSITGGDIRETETATVIYRTVQTPNN